jgi:DNA invertase Pin-like site-specific DNA recombinase
MYIVAGELIARVSGMTWEKFISNRIFEPLQMDLSAPSRHLIGENRNVIEPHAEINGAVRVVNRDDDEVADPAGGIFSSVDDMSRWVIMQMNDGKYGDGLKKRLFSQAVHDEMWTPQTIIPVTGSSVYNTHFGAYGLGWFLIDAAGYKEVFHTGGDTGMSSNVVMMPELRLGIIVLANEDNGIGVSVADQILDSYLNITGTDHVRERLEKQHTRGLLNQQTAGQAGSELRTKNRPGDVIYSGVYTDNWFGDVFVTFEKGVLWLRSERSPTLAGPLLPLEGNELRNDRPALADALRLCRKHKATLVIAKLDRLARNVAFISNLMESGAEFVAVDMPQANRFVVHILAAVAEQEAEAISKRTKAALAAAKARGTRLGGRRVSAERFAEIGAAARQVRTQKADKRAADMLPVIRQLQTAGARTLRQIAAGLNEQNVTTPRGGEWSAVQVQRVLTAARWYGVNQEHRERRASRCA